MAAEKTEIRMRVLVVDDDPFVRRAIVRTLKKKFETTDVGSANEALRVLGEEPGFNIIITDYNLGGGMTGLDLREIACARYPELEGRVILMSGAPSVDEDSPHFPLWLAKPFTPESIAHAISRACEQRVGEVA